MTDAPIASTAHGRVRGATDEGIHVFKGIPYGATTIGAARFHAPAPPADWSGIRDALAYPPMAPQSIFTPGSLFASWTFDKELSEDCLALNVWTPGLRDRARRPVMVWFHGGDFSSLSGSRNVYDGVRLCRRGDVVVVTVNHRLNAFGYMYLAEAAPQLAAAANPGMLDLVAALRWVHDNIAEFGGDPDNVTIFGQSGGGGKVTRLMHMPAAKGLFHKVICQSGGAVNYRNTDPAKVIQGQQAVAAETLKNLNLTGSQIDKLKSVLYRDLLAAGNTATQTLARQGVQGAMGWNPVADDHYVLREFCDWADTIPYMVGNVLSEFSSNLARGEFTKNEWTHKEVDEKLAAAFGDKKDAIVAEYKKLYPNKKVQDVLFLDSRFRPGSKTMLAMKLERTKAPVYNYMFTYEYQVNGGVTAFHCSEIAFAFHALGEPHIRIATGGAPFFPRSPELGATAS